MRNLSASFLFIFSNSFCHSLYRFLKITEDQLIPFDIDTHIVKRNERLNLPKHYHFDFRYLFTINEIEEINIDKNELENYKWVELSEIYDNLNESIIAKKLEKILK